jgi:transglutaminase-like putative cysteine protease
VRVRLVHTTRVEYTADVTQGVMDVRLGPMSDADQRCDRFALEVGPAGAVRRYLDGFGNIAHIVTVAKPHRTIEIVARSEVETLLEDPFAEPARRPAPLAPGELADYLSPSALIPPHPMLRELAAPHRPADPDATFEVVRELSSLVHRTFTYRRYVTSVTTAVDEALALRTGVCQDFAHVLVGLCRSIDIPARYVSGYTVPNGADDLARGRESAGRNRPDPEASHAWMEAYTPTHGWRGFDPTNDLVASAAHVKMAIGRDYADVPPTRGTFRGGAEERLTVLVQARSVA